MGRFVGKVLLMKKLLATVMAGATLVSAQAQLFSPEALNGALFGSLLGGLIGGSSDNGCGYYYNGCGNGFSGQGAAIGAGVGLLAGALVGQARRSEAMEEVPVVYAPASSVSVGYGYTAGGASAYVYTAPNAYLAPGYYYRPTQPNYAVSGTLLGAASGALIGAGSCEAGKGAAIGAAAGLVLGSVAELARTKSQPKPAATPTVPEAVPTANHPETVATAIAEAPAGITSQPCPTSTYTWTPRPQIPDAPRVPDAPTF